MHPVGFAYHSTSKKQLLYTLAGLCSILKEVREERCCRARTMIISTSDDLAKFLIDNQQPPQCQWLHCIVHLCITQSVPAEGIFSNKTEVERQIVACVVCARIKWIDQAFPCAMWVPYPEKVAAGNDDGSEQEAHSQSEEGTDDEEKDEWNISRHNLHRGILRDQHRCYFGPAKKVNNFLCVKKYLDDGH